MTWLLSMVASATMVSQEFCATLDTEYDELIPYGTWWTTNDVRDHRGVAITVCSVSIPFACSTKFAVDDGAKSGCALFSLENTETFNVFVTEKAEVQGRTIYVVDANSDGELDVASQVILVNFSPTTVSEELPVPWSRRHGVLLVGAWMLNRNSWGLSSSHTLKMVVDGTTSTNANPSRVLVNRDDKRSISHEVGHWIGMRRDETAYINWNDGVNAQNCEGWGAGSDDLAKEWDSSAGSEGWADFVAAWAWNTRNSSACALQRDRTTLPDWDLDNDGDSLAYGANPRGQWGCEGIFEDFNSDGDFTDPGEAQDPSNPNIDPPAAYLTARDWLADMVVAADPKGCTGTLAGRSSKQDWVRFWWDMTTDEGIEPVDCASIFDLANPKNWDATPESPATSDDPIRRIEDKADDLGFGAEFDAQKSNGLDHY